MFFLSTCFYLFFFLSVCQLCFIKGRGDLFLAAGYLFNNCIQSLFRFLDKLFLTLYFSFKLSMGKETTKKIAIVTWTIYLYISVWKLSLSNLSGENLSRSLYVRRQMTVSTKSFKHTVEVDPMYCTSRMVRIKLLYLKD